MANPSGRRRQDMGQLSMADHDLLIQIREKVDGLMATCSGLAGQLSKKAETSEMSDHETRIRSLEQFKWQMAAAMMGAQVVIGVGLHYWK